MPNDENSARTTTGRRQRKNALLLGPRKKPYVVYVPLVGHLYINEVYYSTVADPLVHHGRHFGRTIHALCSVDTLLSNGILRSEATVPDESLTVEYACTLLVVLYLRCSPLLLMHVLGKNESIVFSKV